MNGQLSKTATLNQINRIRETINSLKNSEYQVRLRLDTKEPLIRKDNYNHANEIIWGWEQLLKEINSLPDSFIDKSLYEEIASKGIKKTVKLLQYIQDQYIPDRESCLVNLNTGRAF